MTLSPPKSRRRWLQYSLRTLLVVTTLCAIACSWLGVKLQQARPQREAVAALEKLGALVFYDWQYDAQGISLPSPQPPGRLWLRRVLGDDFFQSVHTVELTNRDITDAGLENIGADLKHLECLSQLQWLDLSGTPITDSDLTYLTALSQLQRLDLVSTDVTDAGLEHLKCLNKLRVLNLARTQVTDAGLEVLTCFGQLKGLSLNDTRVTDAGMEHLRSLSQLRDLLLNRTQVTDTGVRNLRAALPKCNVFHLIR
jgi:hypothetical protein